MELNKCQWMDLISEFFHSIDIELGNYKFGIFEDSDYIDSFKDTKLVAVITLEEPLITDNKLYNESTKIKVHFDEIHFWCVTGRKFRNFKVYDDEWVNFLKLNHPNKEKYTETVNEFLFSKEIKRCEAQIRELNALILNCKDNITKYELSIKNIEEKIDDLAKEYNMVVYKDFDNQYQYKTK